ncbi:MAG: polyphosphate kinase 1 [Gemmataceae bacterium]|nr:polyphosphate kinase 1 [Gemmataceae bacterium]
MQPTPAPPVANLDDPALYLNRELSWLQFNRRVLEEAQDPGVPLMERVKFLAIFSSNLDEFYMVRVGNIQQKVQAGIDHSSGADRVSPRVQLERISQAVGELVAAQYRCLAEDVLPALQAKGVVVRRAADLAGADLAYTRELFRREIFPVLTPLATDPAHPFPHLLNKSLNLAVTLRRPGDAEPLFAVVQVPAVLSRFVQLPSSDPTRNGPDGPLYAFTPLEDVIRQNLGDLFPGMELGASAAFRVTRDSEYEIDDEGVEDLMRAIEAQVKARRRGHATRLEIEAGAPPDLESFLTTALDLDPPDVYRLAGPLDLTGLFQIYGLTGFPELRDPPFVPVPVQAFAQAATPWAAVRGRDVLVHHPFESFTHVVDFIEAAADDDRVLAIKQTLYRTSSDSPIVRALQRAADRGKQVTAVIELKARLDEERNILWSKELEKAGVHVVFGFIGLKTHCKVALVVRRDEDNTIRRYVHLATGNYNPTTARIYTDIGFFTANPEFADDASALFNYLTVGYAGLPQWRKLIVAPSRLQTAMIEKIEREAANAAAGKPGRVIAKLNGVLEPAVVKALYKASQAGVRVDLICRGICSLRPGLPGVSENIRVVSIVDRFLEHSRIFYFENGGQPEVFTGSADWMDRNLSRRVEVVFPIEQPDLKQRVIDEVLKTTLADNVKARELLPDGTYRRVKPAEGEPRVRSQARFLELAEAASRHAVGMAVEATGTGTHPAPVPRPVKKAKRR